MALNKDWRDLPAVLAPAAGETVKDWHARIDAYYLANPGVLTTLDAAALKDLEARAQAELDAKAALTDARFPAGADIVNADIAAAAAIAEGKLDLASDAAAGVASRRSLGTGAGQALPGNDGLLAPAQAVSVTRALGTTYRPSTTRPVLVVATVLMTVPPAARAMMYVKVDAVTPAATAIARELLYNDASGQINSYRSITFLVPAGYYYMLEGVVVAGAPTLGIDRVLEQEL